jgi:hypothetical protein
VVDPSQPGTNQLVYSTYIPGGACFAVNVDDNGFAYLTGDAGTTDFPLTGNAFERHDRLLSADAANSTPVAFASVFDPSLGGASSLVYSTLLGGNSNSRGGQGDAGYAHSAGPRRYDLCRRRREHD